MSGFAGANQSVNFDCVQEQEDGSDTVFADTEPFANIDCEQVEDNSEAGFAGTEPSLISDELIFDNLTCDETVTVQDLPDAAVPALPVILMLLIVQFMLILATIMSL